MRREERGERREEKERGERTTNVNSYQQICIQNITLQSLRTGGVEAH